MAAYFAVVCRAPCDGAICWYDGEALAQALPSRWAELFGRQQSVDVEVAKELDATDARWLLCEQNLGVWFPRIARQRGLFTISSHFLVDQATAIGGLVGEGRCGRIVIKQDLKEDLLHRLRLMNFDSESAMTADPHLIAYALSQ